jgi:membrane associated rhomboid family serine protease
LFFPYRARITLYHFPLFTVLVCLLCIGIYTAQFLNQHSLYSATATFCERQFDPGFRKALTRLAGAADVAACARLMLTLYHTKDDKTEIARLAQKIGNAPGVSNADQRTYYENILREAYRSYRRTAPTDLTARLWYPPESWNPLRMLSAAFAHGSWMHLIGNLLFFFAFAATIEILLGPILYLAILIALALGTHAAYSLATLIQPDALPTLGLSGVVMGIIALFTYFLPRARISCFLWLIIFYRRFALPAWLLAAWYIGWDVYAQVTGDGSSRVNLVAHLSGAALGLAIGLVFFRAKRHWTQELVEEKT